jgi:hypothetical protein
VTCPTCIIQGVGEAKTRHPGRSASRIRAAAIRAVTRYAPRSKLRGCCELSRRAAWRAELQCELRALI